MSEEIVGTICREQDVSIHKVRYFTDCKVVLGYICNRTRRFHTYVSNTVQRILDLSESSQWFYVDTKHNPADVGTRGMSASLKSF